MDKIGHSICETIILKFVKKKIVCIVLQNTCFFKSIVIMLQLSYLAICRFIQQIFYIVRLFLLFDFKMIKLKNNIHKNLLHFNKTDLKGNKFLISGEIRLFR